MLSLNGVRDVHGKRLELRGFGHAEELQADFVRRPRKSQGTVLAFTYCVTLLACAEAALTKPCARRSTEHFRRLRNEVTCSELPSRHSNSSQWSGMRIECDTTTGRTLYKVYRSSAQNEDRVIAMMVELHQAGTCIVVGATKSEPDLVFTMGPVHRLLERRFALEIAALQMTQDEPRESPSSTDA